MKEVTLVIEIVGSSIRIVPEEEEERWRRTDRSSLVISHVPSVPCTLTSHISLIRWLPL